MTRPTNFGAGTSRIALQDSDEAAPFAFLRGVFGIGSEAVKAAPIGALVPALTGFVQCSMETQARRREFLLSGRFDLFGLPVRSSAEFYR